MYFPKNDQEKSAPILPVLGEDSHSDFPIRSVPHPHFFLFCIRSAILTKGLIAKIKKRRIIGLKTVGVA
jgi:hypothetical protein